MQNKSWPTKKLGELTDVRMGETLIKKDLTGDGTPIFSAGIDIKPWGFTKKNTLTFSKNSIVLSARGTIGEPRLPLLKKFTATQTTIVVTNKSENVLDTIFLWRFLQTFNFNTIKNQAAIPMMTVSDVNKTEILLPPLKIQKRIVAKIEELFEKIDKTKELREKAQEQTAEILQSALQEAFSKAEKKWGLKKLGDPKVATITSGGTPTRGVEKYYQGGVILWLKSGELNDNENIVTSEEYITEIALKESSAKIFPVNTVLIAIYGATVGKVGILKKTSATNQAIAGINPNKKILDYKFLFNYLIWKRSFLMWRSFGGAQPNISQNIIKKLEIPFPPLSEQKKIVIYLDALREKVEKLKVFQEQQAKELEELKKSILEKAFSGKLINEKK